MPVSMQYLSVRIVFFASIKQAWPHLLCLDVEAIVVLVMVAITFGMVCSGSLHDRAWNELSTTILGPRWGGWFYGPKIPGIVICIFLCLLSRVTDALDDRHYLVTWRSSRWQSAFLLAICFLTLKPNSFGRIFELIMAFDALRLRNIIQLVGILGTPLRTSSGAKLTNDIGSVVAFHLAMIVFAALQVHQTRTALVLVPTCVDPASLKVG